MLNARPYITCRQLIDFIVDYADGVLDAAAHDDFERHLHRCPSCQAYLQTYLQTIALVQAIGEEECAEDVPAELVAAILGERKA